MARRFLRRLRRRRHRRVPRRPRPRRGLAGEIDFATLGGMSSLRNLSLSGNLLTGRLIVPTLGSLQRLDLSRNRFYGPIPGDIAELSTLVHLNLSYNTFSGALPAGVGNLQGLKVLDLRSNGLTDHIGSVLSKMGNVEYLDLSGNEFYGGLLMESEDLSSLADTVKYLNLSSNYLYGGFFSDHSLQLFSDLKVLDVGNNHLSGELPSFDSLDDLRTLSLGNNKLSGLFQEEFFGNTMSLKELDLSGNRFTGYVQTITSTTLKVLNLSSNELSGPLPSSLGSCISVDMSKNMLYGDLSVMYSWEDSLEILDLSSNALSGSFPNDIIRFRSLISIKISNNSLAGSLPPVLGCCPRLSHVDLSLNQFTGHILPSIFTSQTVTSIINLSYSTKSHVLPSYDQLESLDLSDNQLSGSLPPEIGSFRRLKLLALARNALSGELSSEIGKLDELEFLDLSGNHFKGWIPEMPQQSLEVFNISYNDLSGPIPQTLQRFPFSSFHPGNSLLVLPDVDALGHNSGHVEHSLFRTSIWVVIIVCSFGAVILILILFVLLAIQKRRSQAEDSLPLPISFSNKCLLSSASRSKPAPEDLLAKTEECSCSDSRSDSVFLELDRLKHCPSTTGYESSLGSPLSSSPHHIDSRIKEQPAMLRVDSPERLVGELFFLHDSLAFTADELSCAPAEVLGRSILGPKYKATLCSGHVLTIKLFHSDLLKQKKEFVKEAKRIGTIRHPNIISLKGYFWGPTEQERLIIADYVNGDSLADYLYESTTGRYSQVSASQKLKIAIDVGQCLHYLHDRGLPHGNLKPTNIFLRPPDFTAQLTDCSPHRLLARSGTAQQMLNLGTLGYQAPELATASNPCPSLMADIYAFGIILMELLTRRSATDIISGQVGAVDLTDWIQKCVGEGREDECFDKGIASEETEMRVMKELLALSLRCILPLKKRPNIETIFKDLQLITI